MAIVTVKINTSTKKAKHLLGLISEIAKSDKNVEIIESGSGSYNEEFVKEILKSRDSKGKVIKPEDLWK
jgi:hypothetical protein